MQFNMPLVYGFKKHLYALTIPLFFLEYICNIPLACCTHTTMTCFFQKILHTPKNYFITMFLCISACFSTKWFTPCEGIFAHTCTNILTHITIVEDGYLMHTILNNAVLLP